MDPDLYESPPVTLVLPVSICIFPLSCSCTYRISSTGFPSHTSICLCVEQRRRDSSMVQPASTVSTIVCQGSRVSVLTTKKPSPSSKRQKLQVATIRIKALPLKINMKFRHGCKFPATWQRLGIATLWVTQETRCSMWCI